jgi:DNA-binding NarL/FixJ family response regulator
VDVPIEALLAGSRIAIREAVRHAIESSTDVVVVGAASTAAELFHLWERLKPRLVLIDAESDGFRHFGGVGRGATRVIVMTELPHNEPPIEQGTALTVLDANTQLSELIRLIRHSFDRKARSSAMAGDQM